MRSIYFVVASSQFNEAATSGNSGSERQPRPFDRAFLIVAVLLISGLWIFAPHEDPEVGSPIQQTLFGLLYLAAIAALIAQRRAAWPLMRQSWPLLLNIGMVILSIIWSEEPYTTARRAFELVGVTALAFYFVLRLGRRDFLEALALAMTIAAAISVVLIAVVPEIGRMQDAYAGAWRGMFVQKNGLGAAMILGSLTTAAVIEGSDATRHFYRIATLSLMLVLLIGSQSITAVGTGLILAAVAVILLWSRSKRSAKPFIIVACVGLAAITVGTLLGFGPADVLGLFGRDTTLTGRTELWQLAVDAIAQKPVLGYGYQAFFVNHTPVDWDPGHAHNSFLEAGLDTGLIGVCTVIAALGFGIKANWAPFWESRGVQSAWPLLIIFLILLSSGSENMFDTPNISWLLFVAAYLFGIDGQFARNNLRST